jgi:hypothetical protein
MRPLVNPLKEPAGSRPPEPLRARFEALVGAFHIESPSRFRFAELPPFTVAVSGNGHAAALAGGGDRPANPGVGRAPVLGLQPDNGGQRSAGELQALVGMVAGVAYHYGYARTFAGSAAELPPIQGGAVASGSPADAAPTGATFLEQLRCANRSRERWDGGWKVYRTEPNGSMHVEKDGANRLVPPGQYITGRVGQPGASVGEQVQVHAPRESWDVQPGFYFAFGETLPSDHDDASLSRFYFHIKPEHVPWLVGELTGGLNQLRVPFRLKCLTDPAHYQRMDPMVCYVAKRFLTATIRVLARRREELADRLLPGVPLFTKELLPGLGVADEPGDGKSFGQHRSQLVAEGLVDAWLRRLLDLRGRTEAISRRFAAHGLSLAAPHLGESTADQYLLPS